METLTQNKSRKKEIASRSGHISFEGLVNIIGFVNRKLRKSVKAKDINLGV